jgi:hypothetical protein
MFDSGGLYLEVAPGGGRWWRWKNHYGGKEKRLSFGVYPDVNLKAAREKRDACRKQLATGVDPGEARNAEKVAKAGLESFEGIAREWHQKFSKGLSEKYSDLILRRFEQDVFPWIGKRPIAQLESSEMLALLRRIESRGALETTHRIKQKCGSVFCYAVSTGRAQRDPTTGLNGAIPPARVKHHASIRNRRRSANCSGPSMDTKALSQDVRYN